MSATSMANAAIERAAAREHTPGARSARSQAADSDNAFTAAMNAITTYIPTDVLTLYVAGSAIFLTTDSAGASDFDKAWWIFAGGVIATPVVNALVFLAKLRSAGVAIPREVRDWPIWESVAATIAFVFWAAALPATPFSEFSWYDAAFAGFLLGVVSLFLGLISSIILPTATKPAPEIPDQPPPGPLPGA
ncbi:MAG: hypothetical protein AB7V46_18055 [Thermomicrobiales bacterium]